MSHTSVEAGSASDPVTILTAENRELRAYLKAFCAATVDPDECGRDVGVHEANPFIEWEFGLVDEGTRPGRVITGGQVRRAMELVGYDKLKIAPASRTIADELTEARDLRREVARLREEAASWRRVAERLEEEKRTASPAAVPESVRRAFADYEALPASAMRWECERVAFDYVRTLLADAPPSGRAGEESTTSTSAGAVPDGDGPVSDRFNPALPANEEAVAAKARQPKRLPILCLDFDGVLHGYQSGWQGAAIIPDPPVPGAVAFLHAAVERFQVAVYSSRSGQPGGIEAMRGWLMMWLMAVIEDRREAEHVFNLIQWPTEKPAAIVTIDDRAIQFTGSWPSLDEIAGFQPWNKRAATSAVPETPTEAPAHGSAEGHEIVRLREDGSTYEVLGEAEAQICEARGDNNRFGTCRTIYDGKTLVFLRDLASGKLYCRFPDEFRSSRYETLTATQPATPAEGRR